MWRAFLHAFLLLLQLRFFHAFLLLLQLFFMLLVFVYCLATLSRFPCLAFAIQISLIGTSSKV